MSEPYQPPKRSWPRKFADAFRGLWIGVRGQSSFIVHFVAAALVVTAGAILRVNLTQWCLLALCITIVMAAEMFNSALETLSKAIDDQPNDHLARGLNIASAAVLITALGAVAVGAVILWQVK